MALSQTELTALTRRSNIANAAGNVNEKLLAVRVTFWYFSSTMFRVYGSGKEISLEHSLKTRVVRAASIGLSVWLLFQLSALLSSCKDQIANPNSSPIVFPASNISYSKYIDPLFQQRCALSGCHAGSSAQAGLDLIIPSYNSLMNHQPRLVNPGASNNSLLSERIDGRIQPQMPYLSQPLTTNQINGIKKWIDEGAKNN